MDSELHERLFTFLAGRESKADKTVRYMMQSFRRMDALGFQWQEFLRDEASAIREGDRYVVELRRAKATPAAIRNNMRCLLALSRMQGYKAKWKLPKEPQVQASIYTLQDLRGLLTLPYGRSERRRMQGALIVAHLALGWRVGELARLRASHVDPANKSVLLAFPEKGNPQRRLPVHEAFFSPNRAFMSWLKHRPVAPKDPDAVWTFTDRSGLVRVMAEHRVAIELSNMGRKQGVRANCTRARHTCLTAHAVQKKNIMFIRFWAGHSGYNVLSRYLEFVDLGLASHLGNPAWFCKAPRRQPE